MKVLPSILLFVFLQGLAEAQELYPTDQNGINQALQNGGEIYLNAGVYEVTGAINIHSNTRLTGSPDAIIRVSCPNGRWFSNSIGVINGNGNDIEISGFSIDGNCENLPVEYSHTSGDTAHDCESLIHLIGNSNNFMSNVSIHDMKLYDAYSDGITLRFCDHAECYSNLISNCEHEGIFYSRITNSLIHDNNVAGITSDNLRLDNSVNCKVYSNILFSYSGDHAQTYMHGENGLQVGDGGSSHGYNAADSSITTSNIEIFGNTFADNGLQAILLDSAALESSANVFIHNNKFIGKSELETMGIPVELANGTTPTIEQSEQIFSSVFDILKTTLYYSAITGQSDDSISYAVQQTKQGVIAGGIKIIGFRNQVVIDNKTYIQDNNSTIIKSVAVMAPSSLAFWNQGVDKIDKDIHVEVKNGTATATMTVNMRVYSVSYNQITKKTTKTYHTYTATFNDTTTAPQVFPAPQNIKGRIEVYPTFFEVYVPSDGLVKIDYLYGVNVSTHSLMRGEREVKDNIQYTEYTRLDDWSGEFNNTGEWCFIYGAFDESKLHVIATTPYQDINVTNFDINRHDYPKDPISFWFYPTVGFLICLYFIGRFFWRNIWF
jgi:hypothetical protein